MNWKGVELKTVGDFMEHGIDACATREEAREFMRLYVLENGYARENIAYLAGYYNNDTKHRIYDWFEVVHPFFGRSDPTPLEAFEMGRRWAENNGGEQL